VLIPDGGIEAETCSNITYGIYIQIVVLTGPNIKSYVGFD
jgi:hypothetical protein